MSRITCLPSELVILLVKFIASNHPSGISSLKSLSLTCKFLFQFTGHVLREKFTIREPDRVLEATEYLAALEPTERLDIRSVWIHGLDRERRGYSTPVASTGAERQSRPALTEGQMQVAVADLLRLVPHVEDLALQCFVTELQTPMLEVISSMHQLGSVYLLTQPPSPMVLQALLALPAIQKLHLTVRGWLGAICILDFGNTPSTVERLTIASADHNLVLPVIFSSETHIALPSLRALNFRGCRGFSGVLPKCPSLASLEIYDFDIDRCLELNIPNLTTICIPIDLLSLPRGRADLRNRPLLSSITTLIISPHSGHNPQPIVWDNIRTTLITLPKLRKVVVCTPKEHFAYSEDPKRVRMAYSGIDGTAEMDQCRDIVVEMGLWEVERFEEEDVDILEFLKHRRLSRRPLIGEHRVRLETIKQQQAKWYQYEDQYLRQHGKSKIESNSCFLNGQIRALDDTCAYVA